MVFKFDKSINDLNSSNFKLRDKIQSRKSLKTFDKFRYVRTFEKSIVENASKEQLPFQRRSTLTGSFDWTR